MKKKLEAILVGGPHDGQTYELDGPNQEVAVVSRVLERNGEWREVFTARYKLKSSGPPLRYEFENQ